MSEDMPHAREWKLKDGQLHRMSMVDNGFGRPLATSTDGSVLVNFESPPNRCVIRRREQNEWRTVRTISSTIEPISGALRRDQGRLVIGSITGEIEFWDLEAKSPRKLWANQTPQNQSVVQLHFAMNDRLLVSQLVSNAVVQRISDTGLEPVLTLPTNYDRTLDVAPNGGSFAVATRTEASVWSLTFDPPQLINTLSASQDVSPRSVNYSPDGRQLAVAYDNGQILLQDLESGTVAAQAVTPRPNPLRPLHHALGTSRS